MKLQVVPSRQGAVWVRNGLRIFFRRPLAFSILFALCLFLAPLLLFAVAPLTSLAFVIATGRALEGRFPTPSVFIEPLRRGRARLRAQLALCAVYAVGFTAVFLLSDMVGGDAFSALLAGLGDPKATPQEIQALWAAPGLLSGRALLLVGMAALAIPFWHAPALVHFGGLSAPKALFFSTVASWRNRGALAVYGIGWVGVGILFSLLMSVVLSLLGQSELIVAAIVPATLMFYAAFYASLYFTFADSFAPEAAAGPSLEAPP